VNIIQAMKWWCMDF